MVAGAMTFLSCKKEDASKKDPANITIDGRELSLNRTRAWVTSGGYLSDIDIFFNDSKATTGLSQITFTSELAICGGLPEVGHEYPFNTLAACRFSSASFFTEARTPDNPTDFERWYSPKGSITFSVAEKDTEKKVYHFAATYTVTFVDLDSVEHGPIVGKFDIEQTY